MTFRVGQKVVYVGGFDVDPYEDEPSKDEVYTISWIGAVNPATTNVDLLELPSPETLDLFRGYNQLAFRPVVERETDISIFTQMLNPSKRSVDA